MGLYAGTDTWIDDVYQFEQTDPVQGGTDGIDNRPLKELADRTVWLKNSIGRITRLEDEVVFTTNGTITGVMAGHLIVAKATGILNLTLASAATFTHGAIVLVSSFCNAACVVNITPQSGQPITDPIEGNSTVISMHHREHLTLIALTNHWKIVAADGNFYCAGEEVKGRKERANTLALKGQLLNRTQYPRLWKYIDGLTMWQEVVPEGTWFTDTFTYRGCFTNGDGSTTFRIPDERAMFERMLDAGRGVDYSRTHNYPGGYEADAIKAHNHTFTWKKGQADQNESGTYGEIYDQSATHNRTTTTTTVGGVETIVKNVGKLNLIKF